MNPLILSFLGVAFNAFLNNRPVPTVFCCKYPDRILYFFFLGGPELPEVVMAEAKTMFPLIGSEANIVSFGLITNMSKPIPSFQFPEGEAVITTFSPSLVVGKTRTTVKRVDANTYQIF